MYLLICGIIFRYTSENMLLSTRLFFYDHYLENFWNHPKKSKLIEMRIAIPLLLGRVREIEVQSRGNALMESHIEWLLVEIYHDLEHINARSICLLSRFINWNWNESIAEILPKTDHGAKAATLLVHAFQHVAHDLVEPPLQRRVMLVGKHRKDGVFGEGPAGKC